METMRNYAGLLGGFLLLTMIFTPGEAMAGEMREGAEEGGPSYLEPSVVDDALNKIITKPLSKVVGDKRIEIAEIPGFDPALDKFGKVSPFDIEMGFTLADKYIWRGQRLGENTSWQPYVTVGTDFLPLGTLSGTWWMNWTHKVPGKNNTESDFTIDYNFDFLDGVRLLGGNEEKIPYLLKKMMDFNLDAGFTYYYFPPDESHSKEWYLGVSYNLPLNPYVAAYHDYRAGSGTWWEFGVSQDIDLNMFTLALYSKLCYNKGQWSDSSALQTLDFGGSIPFALGKHMTIEPFISYSKNLNRTKIDSEPLTQDELYGGFNFSISS